MGSAHSRRGVFGAESSLIHSFGHAALSGLCLHGDEILKGIGQRWGEMLEVGDGTTWEHFSEFGHGQWPTRSRCHPFSSYVVKYFVKYILGVEILAPGFSRVRVRPQPPRYLKKATGTVPTPHGPLAISWSRKKGMIDLTIEAPSGVRVLTR